MIRLVLRTTGAAAWPRRTERAEYLTRWSVGADRAARNGRSEQTQAKQSKPPCVGAAARPRRTAMTETHRTANGAAAWLRRNARSVKRSERVDVIDTVPW